MDNDLKKYFNENVHVKHRYYFQKESDNVLLVKSYPGSNTILTYYDFFVRMSYVVFEGKKSCLPFSELDPEVLAFMRDKLVELKGNPPPLPENIATEPLTVRKNP